MANRLNNLEVTKVDFVNAGANPKADIKLFKGRGTSSDNEKESLVEKILTSVTDALEKRCVFDASDLENMEYAQARLDNHIKQIKKRMESPKGEGKEMVKIDKSKMTPEELAAYESIVKKYGTEAPALEDGVEVPLDQESGVKKNLAGDKYCSKGNCRHGEINGYLWRLCRTSKQRRSSGGEYLQGTAPDGPSRTGGADAYAEKLKGSGRYSLSG